MWAKVDDRLFSHPKVAQCSQSAMGLWVKALSWSVCYSRDGIVPKKTVAHLGGKARDYRQLVEAGLWEEVEGGFQFHDWADYLPTEWEARTAKRDAEKDPSRVKGGKASRTSSGQVQDRNRTDSGQKQDKVRTDSGLSQVELCPDFSRHDAVSPPKTSAEPQLNLSPVPSRPVPYSVPTVRGDGAPAPVQETLTGEVVEPSADNAGTLVAEWIEHCKVRPPGNIVGQTSKQIRMLLEDGLTADQIRPGLAAWQRKGAHPSALPSFVNQELNSTPETTRTNTNGLTDQQWQAAYQRAIDHDTKELRQ